MNRGKFSKDDKEKTKGVTKTTILWKTTALESLTLRPLRMATGTQQPGF